MNKLKFAGGVLLILGLTLLIMFYRYKDDHVAIRTAAMPTAAISTAAMPTAAISTAAIPTATTLQLDHNQTKKIDIDCFLLVLVLSGVTNTDKREAVRNTWIKETRTLQPKVDMRFVIGTDELKEEDLLLLLSEQRHFDDLVLLPDVLDAYHNLTRKVRNAYAWVVQHAHFEYLLKTDDDSYITVKPLLEELVGRPKPGRLYWGFMHTNIVPLKGDKKNAEHNWFMCKTYLQFASGAGYIISSDAIRAIARNVDMLQIYDNEDVSVSTWLSGFLLERKHDSRFNVANLPCQRNQVLTHWLSSQDMYKLHARYLQDGTLCTPVVGKKT